MHLVFAGLYSLEWPSCPLLTPPVHRCTEPWVAVVSTSSCCSLCGPCRRRLRVQVLGPFWLFDSCLLPLVCSVAESRVPLLSQMDSWCVCVTCVTARNASRPPSATAHGASPLSKSSAIDWCLSVAAWRGRRKSACIAPRRHPPTRPFSAAPRTCATATPPGAL